MPICPRCNTTIHEGSEHQCPACGYSLRRAQEIFGDGQVEFTRVVDAAGVLTHQERMRLVSFLADLERNINPVALCIYITDHGVLQDFRTHAHWILNHARIHHPSFGKREQQINEPPVMDITERDPDEPQQEPEPEEEPGWLARQWQKVSSYVRDAFHPYPPPARQEWMLILVMDVQLEVACFSWGYMLDPYINPDSINSCILKAKLLFRERATVPALRTVMKSAVHLIARDSHRLHRARRKSAARRNMHLMTGAIGLGCLATALPAEATQEPAPAPAELVAEDPDAIPAGELTAEAPQAATAPGTPAADAPAAQPGDQPAAQEPAPPPVIAGQAASMTDLPQWSTEHQEHVNSGKFAHVYNLLQPKPKPVEPAPAEAEEDDDKKGSDKKKGKGKDKDKDEPLPEQPAEPEPEPLPVTEESDTTVLGHYCSMYMKPSSSGLCDPQHLLNSVAREDVESNLRLITARARHRIYVSVFQQTQSIPLELTATNLVRYVSAPHEYAAIIQYTTGDTPGIALGFRDINATDAERFQWQEEAQTAARKAGGGAKGLMAAIEVLDKALTPKAKQFVPRSASVTDKPPRIDLNLKEDKPKAISTSEIVKAWLADPQNTPLLITIGCLLLIPVMVVIGYLVRRRSGHLITTDPDLRLGSTYGAGVSRYVRYLEGKEAEVEKKLF